MSTKKYTGYNYGTLPTTTTTSSTTFTDPPFPSNLTFIARTTRQTRTLISNRRPWSEFFSVSYISLPSGYSDATSRIRRNFNYFRFNYSFIVLLIVFLSLLWHPISMIVFLLLFLLWLILYFSRDEPVRVLNREIDDRFVLLALSFVTVLALVFTHVGFNVLVSLLIGVHLVGLHAAFRGVEDVYLDEEEVSDGGLVPVAAGEQPMRRLSMVV